MFIKKKVTVKLFKRKDSGKRCLLKKRLLWNFLNLKIPTNVFIKKEKVLVKHFKGKDFMEICLLKKRLFGNFLNAKIRSKYVY